MKHQTAQVARLVAPPRPTSGPLPPSIQRLITALANEEVARSLRERANEPAPNSHVQADPAPRTLLAPDRRLRACT